MNDTVYVASFWHLATGSTVTRVFDGYESYIKWLDKTFDDCNPIEQYAINTSIAIYVGGEDSVVD